MIPSIEQICEDLAAGRITVQQAIKWLHEHMRREDQRDIFAAAALQGLLSNSEFTETLQREFEKAGGKREEERPVQSAVTARIAFGVADAMLAERAKA